MVNGGIGAKRQRNLDADAHLSKNCTGISGRKNSEKKNITIPYKRHYRTLLVLAVSVALPIEIRKILLSLCTATGTKVNSKHRQV